MENKLKKFIEIGADLEHKRWAKWQKYLHSKLERGTSGRLIMPKELEDHWERQINTDYKDLSETEKLSDRNEVEKYIPIIKDIFLNDNEDNDNEDIDKILENEITEDDYQFTEKGFGW